MELYRSIGDLPVALFDKINRTGDVSLLIKSRKKGEKLPDLEKAWEGIYDEFIAEFGLSEIFITYLSQMHLAIQYYKQGYIDGNRAMINLAKVKRYEAEELYKENSKAPSNIYAIVSKYMGFRVDPQTISTREFYQYLKLASQSKPGGNGKEN